MVIDVLINSCARPDILEISIDTFRKYVKTSHDLRYVILEDKVKNKYRQAKGKEWILNNKNLFDEIHFAEKRMGPGFFFGPIVKLCKSDYFFHLEDDTEFIVEINLDSMLDIIQNNDYIVEIILNRGKDINKRNGPKNIVINNLKLIEFDLFSVATGLFNTQSVKNIINEIGWDKQLHEFGVLTPTSKKLEYRKFILGQNEKHYIHLSEKRGYRKGSWKND